MQMDMDSGDHGDGGMAMSSMVDCYGKPIPERQGNWQGHVFPGVIFIIWATHWMISASWRHIVATRSGRPYVSRTTEGLLPMIPALQGFNRCACWVGERLSPDTSCVQADSRVPIALIPPAHDTQSTGAIEAFLGFYWIGRH